MNVSQRKSAGSLAGEYITPEDLKKEYILMTGRR
ncbi:hypothetical protein C5S36_14305 [Candidatus Methanophagaceae archaeon]|nr:hypothetical protein C5S36_14305 [Methanophagales archaeon]